MDNEIVIEKRVAKRLWPSMFIKEWDNKPISEVFAEIMKPIREIIAKVIVPYGVDAVCLVPVELKHSDGSSTVVGDNEQARYRRRIVGNENEAEFLKQASNKGSGKDL